MKFFRRSNKSKSNAKKSGQAAAGAPSATPQIGELRQDSPAERVDLSDGAFQKDFPNIAKRMDKERKDHDRRRTSERTAAAPPVRGEETTDT